MLSSSVNKIGDHKEIIFTYKSELGNFNIGILSSYGATLNRIEIPFQNKKFNLIQGYNNIDDFKKAYRGVLLAPFPNRIKNGQYVFENNTYQLPINRPTENNALHGFLYNQSFKIVEKKVTEDKSKLILRNDYKGELEGYPFRFSTEITYVWEAPNKLEVFTEITNSGKNNMPLGLGWHPYFQFPQSINKIDLKMNTTKKFLVDEQMIPTLETAKFSSYKKIKKIEAENFDDCFEVNNSANVHLTTLIDALNGISLTVEQPTTAYKYLQVYTPPTRDCIAIEPMTCPPNAFNNQLGLIKLQPNEKYICSYTIHLKFAKV